MRCGKELAEKLILHWLAQGDVALHPLEVYVNVLKDVAQPAHIDVQEDIMLLAEANEHAT